VPRRHGSRRAVERLISANQRRLKVGVLTPHAAAGPEIEIPEMSQGRVTVTVARIRSTENAAGTESTAGPTSLRALTRPEAVDRDAACFGDGSVDVVGPCVYYYWLRPRSPVRS
jgi:hypothetical protein